MKVTPELVRHVAALAQLELTAEEEVRLVGELSAIISAMEVLAQVDTSGVEPSTWVTAVEPVVRADVVSDVLTAQQALAPAPRVVDGAFAIPQVLE